MYDTHAARMRVFVNFLETAFDIIHACQLRRLRVKYRKSSKEKLVISGPCGTFPCVFMLLQNFAGVWRSIARCVGRTEALFWDFLMHI
jgi:hypothetical protein